MPTIIKANVIDGPLIEKTMHMEDCFLPTLQLDKEEKTEILQEPHVILFLAMKDGEVIGECYGVRLEDKDDVPEDDLEREHFLDIIHKYDSEKTLYCYSLGVIASQEGKGIGSDLLGHLVKESKSQGYARLLSHTRPGASTKIHEHYGGKVLEVRENWYNTGETYNFMEITL